MKTATACSLFPFFHSLSRSPQTLGHFSPHPVPAVAAFSSTAAPYQPPLSITATMNARSESRSSRRDDDEGHHHAVPPGHGPARPPLLRVLHCRRAAPDGGEQPTPSDGSEQPAP
jgi:hypothetical protein